MKAGLWGKGKIVYRQVRDEADQTLNGKSQ